MTATEALPECSDLLIIAEELAGDPNYARLSTAIRKAATAQACLSDLKQARSCVEALVSLRRSFRGRGSLERGATELSLMTTATQMYVRATATAAKRGERGSIKIDLSLTASELADHELLIQLRNRGLSHVYSEEPIDGHVWHAQVLFLRRDPDGWVPASASRGVQFDQGTLNRLVRQVPVAERIMLDKFQKRMLEVSNLFNLFPVSIALFERSKFDPVKAFGSDLAARQALSPSPGGAVTATIYDRAQSVRPGGMRSGS